MRATRLLVAVACALIASPASSQRLNPSASEILGLARPLLPSEIAIVLAAARDAVSGRTCRLSYVANGPGPEVLMGPGGRPRFVRATSGYDASSRGFADSRANGTQADQGGHVDVITFTEYTGRSARKCDGTPLNSELVIEYEHKSTGKDWTVKARERIPYEFATPLFDMLAGATPVNSGDRRSIDNRPGRALVAPWKLPPGAEPGGSLPAATSQSLWIDTVSMLPLRWAISVPAMPERGTPAIPDYGLSFNYVSLDLRPPEVVLSNDCVR